MTNDSLNIPSDLEAFLNSGVQFAYNADDCEVGEVKLVRRSELALRRFPVETSSLTCRDQDPNAPGVNSYLVLAVDLVASCNDDYSPAGLLLWLPVEKRYGCWDESHCTIELFPADTAWSQIAAEPIRYLEGSCGGAINPIPTEVLIPWQNHPYGDSQVYKPQPA